MSWLAFWRRKQQAVASSQAAAARTIGGRRFVAGVPYLLPKDIGETQRLDFQHYLLRYALKGNYAAPIRKASDILDVGCGTGRWAMEVAAEYPDANVIGGRVGAMVETNTMTALTALCAPTISLGIADEQTYDATLARARDEFERGRYSIPFYIAYGRKPGA